MKKFSCHWKLKISLSLGMDCDSNEKMGLWALTVLPEKDSGNPYLNKSTLSADSVFQTFRHTFDQSKITTHYWDTH